jgi:predicted transcriptional regulator
VLFAILSGVLGFTGFDLENLEEIKISPQTIVPYLASANLILAVFNLIPAFPMDGGRILRAFLAIKLPRAKATQIAGGIGQFLAMFFILFGLFNNPILMLIGIFIFLGAGAEVSHTQQESFLKGFKVQDALMQKFQIIGADAPLSKAVEKLLNSQATHFVVVKDDVAVGTLSRDEIIKGLKEGGETSLVERFANMKPMRVETFEDLNEVWRKMGSEKQKVALVIENGQFLGILDQENIAEFVMVKSAMSHS